jgi:hypothetical protein
MSCTLDTYVCIHNKPRGTVIRSADENHICRTSKSVF